MRLVLFQPEIPGNTGALMRLASALGLGLDIIEPCGFLLDDRRLRRAAMDYRQGLDLICHRSWAAFRQAQGQRRLLLFTTAADAERYTDFAYQPGDLLMFGQESAGAPPEVHAAATARLRIPLRAGTRSLNLAQAAAMAAGEAVRQCGDRLSSPLPAMPGVSTPHALPGGTDY